MQNAPADAATPEERSASLRPAGAAQHARAGGVSEGAAPEAGAGTVAARSHPPRGEHAEAAEARGSGPPARAREEGADPAALLREARNGTGRSLESATVSPATTADPAVDTLFGVPPSSRPEPVGPAAPTTPVGSPQEAIPLHAEWLAARGGGTARLRLHPPELGEIELSVRVRGAAVDVVIRTDKAAAARAALDGRELLVEALAGRDLRIEQLDVRTGSREPFAGDATFREPDGEARERGFDDSRSRDDGPGGGNTRVAAVREMPPVRSDVPRAATTAAVDVRV